MKYDKLKVGQVIAQRVKDEIFVCIISNTTLYDEDTIYNIPTFKITDRGASEDYGKETWYLSTKDVNDSIWHLLPYYQPANELKSSDKRKIIKTILINGIFN